MSIVVTVHEDGEQKLYFRIAEDRGILYAERAGKSSVSVGPVEQATSLESTVVKALLSMKRKDEEWKNRETSTQ